MFWADRVAKEIIKSGKYKPYWVDDMKTPSGRIHVGSLRGVVVHDLVYKALLDAGAKPKFTYVFDDQDPMDALPVYLEPEKWSQYLGRPLFTIPSPDGKEQSYAKYFANEFEGVFNKIGSHPEIIWASSLYKTGKMNDEIRICLNSKDIIKKIYEKLYKKKLPADWYPFIPVCPNCGKESTTKVTGWDGKLITICCNVDAVDWTRGCGICTKVSPFSDDGKYVGKLPWKIEWAVKWKVIGITIEGAGKDHMSKGGSHDVARLVCERVINYPTPYPVGYEFFLIAGRKMSSSKGLGSSAKEVSETLPSYLLRFLMVRTQIQQAINFDPFGSTIPDLFDEYDRCRRAYFTKSDPDLARIFELSQIDAKRRKIFIPRFRTIAQIMQFPNVNINDYFSKEKRGPLNDDEKVILTERIKYAKLWLEKYAPEEAIFSVKKEIPGEASKLTELQKNYLQKIIELIGKVKSAEDLQTSLYNLANELKLSTKEAFNAIYLALLGKPFGPKAAWLIHSLDKEFVKKRFSEIQKTGQKGEVSEYLYSILDQPDIFTIDPEVKRRFPTVTVAIAIIKGVTIQKEDKKLQQEIDTFLSSVGDLKTQKLGEYSEILSYRRIYKETGIDWHSRRPSPEALLRRVVLKKGLYQVNTCVDAYNLVVMRNRVSSGAFDLDKIKFPTVLRFAKKGEKIHLLGDSEPTEYKEGEIAYFDQVGGFNIDFNFRDAQRTMVTEKTKNLLINIEGAYEISRSQVEKTLTETIEIITKYCGGKVEIAGIII